LIDIIITGDEYFINISYIHFLKTI